VPARVFKKDKHIHKLYDTMKLPVNLDLLKLSLPEAEVEDLSKDKRFQHLRYKFRDGQHEPLHKRQFVPLIETLQRIHKEGYVHSDIRSVNLIFSYNRKEAWILDFDLAGRVSTCYPTNFNHCNIPERHQSAKAHCNRETVHDWYSLGMIMSASHVYLNIGEAVIEAVKKGKCDDIVEKLQT
jgi:serine/threonine protein kinase